MNVAPELPAAPPSRRYTSAAIKGTALVEESQRLLREWVPGESADGFTRRVVAENTLGRATAARSADVVRLVFARRFLVHEGEPGRSVRELLLARGPGRWFSGVALLLAARSDSVVRDTVVQLLPRQRARGSETITTPIVIDWLTEAEHRGSMERPWSPTVRESVAQHVLQLLTDVQVLGPSRRGVREFLPYRPSLVTIGWLLANLRGELAADWDVVRHPDWSILQLGEAGVLDAVFRLAEHGLFDVQSGGELLRISWRSPAETLRVLRELPDVG